VAATQEVERQTCQADRRSRGADVLDNKVNAAASSTYQPKGVRDGRAAHITAKVTGRTDKSEVVLDIPGVCRRRHARKA